MNTYPNTPNLPELELLELLEKVARTKSCTFVLGNIIGFLALRISRPRVLKNLGPENITTIAHVIGESPMELIGDINHLNKAFNYQLNPASLERLKLTLVAHRRSAKLTRFGIED